MRRCLPLLLGLLAAGTARAQVPGLPVKPPRGPVAEAQTSAWKETVRKQAEPGDWLVVRGTAVGDQLVAAATLGRLTHAAVLDKERDEVIEAIASGVVVTPLSRFLAGAHRLMIVRPPGWTPEAGRAAVARARSRVGQGYDWTGLVGAQRDSRFYCTELAVDAYQGRARGWKLSRIIFPARLPALGRVVFDSGPRADQVPPSELFARRLAGARGVSYAAEVAPGLFRGGQPDEEGVAWLKSMGIKTVINLRHYHGSTEKKRVEAAGMRYERIALESSDAPSPGQVRRFLELVTDPSLYPIYVHCLHGVDRTGTLMAVYRMEMEGWTNAEALAEMDHFGAHKLWRDLRAFVRAYRPATAGPP